MATLQPGEKSRMYALGGIARGGAFRGGYVDNRIYINIDGVAHAGDVLLDTLTITDVLDETPNTCGFRVHGYVPEDGAELIVTRGSQHTTQPLFAGYALTVQQLYAGVPRHVQADVRAVDYTWLLAMQKVTGQYRNLSATDIVTDLIAKFAAVNGFTTVNVAAGLPVLEQITFTDEDLPDAITRTCRRIGAYWYVDYRKDVHVFFEDVSRVPPVALTPTHPSLTNFTRLHERTQGLTRVYVEGRGSSLLAGVEAGATMLPMTAVDMFTAGADVFLKVSVSGADSSRHLDFTGVVPGGGGSLVGPGMGPSAAITLATQAGAGVDSGTHGYAVTFTTAAGESLPSPIATISTGVLPNPTVPPGNPWNYGFTGVGNGSTVPIGTTCHFTYAYGTHATDPYANQTLAGSTSGPVVTVSNQDPYNPTMSQWVSCQFPYSLDSRVKWIVLYMFTANLYGWVRYFYVANDPAQAALGNLYRHNFIHAPSTPVGLPASNTTTANQVLISAIPVGAATVTGRKLYRTAANLSPLKLLTTIANNTATTHTDTAADATLGAAAPVGDTSGLQQPAGIVYPGAPTMAVASTAPFNATGGLALVGEQAIRYSSTGVTGQGGALGGIPASGYGAITGPISYNTAIRAAPLLTGIPATGARSLPVPLNAGDEVYAVVQVDDAARQAQLAADLNVASGIREEWVSDRRLSIPEARARGQATLLSRPLVDATVEYTCRDTRTASGLTLQVTLPAPTNVSGTYKIQQVTWSNFRPRPEQPPTAHVTASSRRFSFENLLRIVKTKE